ncbi:YslB family protein [Lentibacillus sp. Marseille-P4043]|uniref:YslB family protein n=1 Tax=Lentibacillus sp. Marseille-P4043 TaxID=2040293 RepID=UPI000D0AF743|nr:YslB family protein [Lentibacillus sp. Marseille-P4043]
MAKDQNSLSITLLDELQSSGAGYNVLRYISLPELLGSEANTLLYYIGKDLARKLEIQSLEDVYHIFEKLGWGRLELVKEKRKELIFNLMADSVANRLNAPFPTEFRIEAGFLAESLQLIKGISCECLEEINKKILQVEFSVIYT